jgi:isopentenyl diphosphate isomerase/L-lactate dehydrogenase-like FMN-dependent dehydrogenase
LPPFRVYETPHERWDKAGRPGGGYCRRATRAHVRGARLAAPVNIDDVRLLARRRLPRTAFDAIDGGAGAELTLRRNREAFDHLLLRPRALADVRERDLGTTVLGQPISLPLLLTPAGYTRMAHGEAELAAARAAARAGTIYGVGSFSSYTLEEVARASTAPLWFQIYPPAEPAAREELVERVERAGYAALCVTIDAAVGGIRERERRSGLRLPLRVTPRLLRECAVRPRWTLDYLRGGAGRGLQGLPAAVPSAADARPTPAANTVVTVEAMRHLRRIWGGPLLAKGILRDEECRLLLDLGVDGIVVSNHGARQLDSVPAAIEALPEVVAAVDGQAEVLVDGGFRRGTDVVKALILGARAVAIGRPYLYGLAAGGEAGVLQVIELFRREIDVTLGLLGCASLADLDGSMLRGTVDFAGVLGEHQRVPLPSALRGEWSTTGRGTP